MLEFAEEVHILRLDSDIWLRIWGVDEDDVYVKYLAKIRSDITDSNIYIRILKKLALSYKFVH